MHYFLLLLPAVSENPFHFKFHSTMRKDQQVASSKDFQVNIQPFTVHFPCMEWQDEAEPGMARFPSFWVLRSYQLTWNFGVQRRSSYCFGWTIIMDAQKMTKTNKYF